MKSVGILFLLPSYHDFYRIFIFARRRFNFLLRRHSGRKLPEGREDRRSGWVIILSSSS